MFATNFPMITAARALEEIEALELDDRGDRAVPVRQRSPRLRPVGAFPDLRPSTAAKPRHLEARPLE